MPLPCFLVGENYLKERVYKIEIPEKALRQTGFKKGDALSLSVTHKQILVRPANLLDQLPRIKFWWYFLPAAILTLVLRSEETRLNSSHVT